MGVFNNKRDRNVKEARYTTTSLKLAQGFMTILRSIGTPCSLSIRKPAKGGIIEGRQMVSRRESYQLIFSLNASFGYNKGRNGNVKKYNNVDCNEYRIIKIGKTNFDDFVYDLEMEGHQSFVANGILVHNSATPWRDMGDDILIDGCFGKCISDINASFLIKKGFLVKPVIYFQKISNMRGIKKSTYQTIYKNSYCRKRI